MRKISKGYVVGVVGIIATFAVGGFTLMMAVDKTLALYGGMSLLILAGLLIIALAIMLIMKRGIIWSMDKKNKQTNVIKNTDIDTRVKNVKDAVGAEFEGNNELDNVKVKLEADNVERAVGASFKSSNGSTPLSARIMGCSSCHKMFSKAFTGHLPEETDCPYCGHKNKVEK